MIYILTAYNYRAIASYRWESGNIPDFWHWAPDRVSAGQKT